MALFGELGSGKTTLTQEIGKILGVSSTINSPTFTLLKTYPTQSKHFSTLSHIDAYRLNSQEELHQLGVEDYFQNSCTLTIIEWPENIQNILPRQQTLYLQIIIPPLNQNYRLVKILNSYS